MICDLKSLSEQKLLFTSFSERDFIIFFNHRGPLSCERKTNSGLDCSPGSESEFPVGDWQKLEGMNTLFLGTAK